MDNQISSKKLTTYDTLFIDKSFYNIEGKQLPHLVGEERFTAARKIYFCS